MTVEQIMTELRAMGSEQTKKTFLRHGGVEPMFGVKIGDMKTIVKKIKKDHELAKQLFDTGNSDAMYLAGLISDPQKMTIKDLQHWADKATWHMVSDFAVPWTAAESPHALTLANKWINGKSEQIQCTGWNTYSSYISITDNAILDKKEIKALMDKVTKEIQQAPNRVRYNMNNFLISAGGYIPELREHALKLAVKIGKVTVDMGDTACKVPDAKDYISKMAAHGSENRKKKTAKC